MAKVSGGSRFSPEEAQPAYAVMPEDIFKVACFDIPNASSACCHVFGPKAHSGSIASHEVGQHNAARRWQQAGHQCRTAGAKHRKWNQFPRAASKPMNTSPSSASNSARLCVTWAAWARPGSSWTLPSPPHRQRSKLTAVKAIAYAEARIVQRKQLQPHGWRQDGGICSTGLRRSAGQPAEVFWPW